MRGRSLALVAVLCLAGRLEAATGGASSWIPLPQLSPQQQTHLTNGLSQAASDIAGRVGGIVAGGTTSVYTALAGYTAAADALWQGDYDLAREEFLTATLSNIAVATGAWVGMVSMPVLGPLAPAAPVAGALLGGWIYQESGIEPAIRGAFQRRADQRGSDQAAERLRLRDRLTQARQTCADASDRVAQARGLIDSAGEPGPGLDGLRGDVMEAEAAVQALEGRFGVVGLGGGPADAAHQQALVGELADLEWIAGEACRIASLAAATDNAGARRIWQQEEGPFLADRIASRHTAVLARIDLAEGALRQAAAERASQRAEVERLTSVVDGLAARLRSARDSIAAVSRPLDRAGGLLEEAGASVADCSSVIVAVSGAIQRILALTEASASAELRSLENDLAKIPIPSDGQRASLEALEWRRTSLQRNSADLEGLAARLQRLRAALDRWRASLSAAESVGSTPAQARSEAEMHRRNAETCRARAEALAGLAGSRTGGTQGQADCDRNWPGTVLTRDPVTGAEKCQCPRGSALSKVSRACLALPGGTGGATALGGCSHMPGTMIDSRTGECRCALGTWDVDAGRCVDTAAAARAQDVAAKQAAAECENLYSRIRVFRLSTDPVGQAAAAEAERGARARGCDVARIAEAKGPPAPPPVGGGTGSTGSGPPVGGGTGSASGGRRPATCQVTEQPGAGGVALVYEQTALGNHFNVYVFTAPKKDLAAIRAHWNSQPGFRLVGEFGSYSLGLSAAQKACAKRTAATSTAEPEEGLCNCVDEKGRRYTEAWGQPCGTGGQAIRDYNCPPR